MVNVVLVKGLLVCELEEMEIIWEEDEGEMVVVVLISVLWEVVLEFGFVDIGIDSWWWVDSV